MVHNALEFTNAANGMGLMSPKFFSCRACMTAGIGANAMAMQMRSPNNGQMVVTTKCDNHAAGRSMLVVKREGGCLRSVLSGDLATTRSVRDEHSSCCCY